jgi:hypothetical protein
MVIDHAIFARVEQLTAELAAASETSALADAELERERTLRDQASALASIYTTETPDRTLRDTFVLLAKMWAAIIVLALLAIARMS